MYRFSPFPELCCQNSALLERERVVRRLRHPRPPSLWTTFDCPHCEEAWALYLTTGQDLWLPLAVDELDGEYHLAECEFAPLDSPYMKDHTLTEVLHKTVGRKGHPQPALCCLFNDLAKHLHQRP